MKPILQKKVVFIYKRKTTQQKHSTDPTTTNATHTVTSVITH